MKRGNRLGFTLVELLVAAGITALLASLMVSSLAQTAQVWARSAQRMSGEAKARQVFEQVAADIGGMYYLEGADSWFAADISGLLAFDPAGDNLAGARFGAEGTTVRFVTTRRGRNLDLETVSAPVTVGYRIERREVAGRAGYFLCRAELRPAGIVGSDHGVGTLEPGYDVTAAAHDPVGAAAPGDSAALAAWLTDEGPSSDVAEHVIDFGLRGGFRDPARPGAIAFGDPPIPGVETAGPCAVDLMLRILTEEGAKRLAGFEAGGNGGSRNPEWGRLVQAHSRVFTRRVLIGRGSP